MSARSRPDSFPRGEPMSTQAVGLLGPTWPQNAWTPLPAKTEQPQATGAAGAPVLGKEPSADQPTPQRVQVGQQAQSPQDERREPGQQQGQSDPSAQLTSQEQAVVRQLQATDRQVRAHEQAHLAAGGGLTRGGARFSFEKGPDEQNYAVGGEVSIDTSPVAGDPQATQEKARQIRAAALAPADPSAQDLSVAAQASQMETQAAAEAAQLAREESQATQDEARVHEQYAASDNEEDLFPRRPAPPPLSVRLNPLSKTA